MNQYFEAFIRLFFPEYCLSCKIFLEIQERGVCSNCLDDFQARAYDLADCFIRHDQRALNEAWALFPYDEVIKNLIHLYKFETKTWILQLFKPYLERFVIAIESEVTHDFIVPIPSDALRKIARYYNPTEAIAEMISSLNNNKIERFLISKKSRVLSQSDLRQEERLANIYGAFKISPIKSIAGKKILLIDDVFTTGSTVNEVARLLKEKGAAQVDCLVLARTLHHEQSKKKVATT